MIGKDALPDQELAAKTISDQQALAERDKLIKSQNHWLNELEWKIVRQDQELSNRAKRISQLEDKILEGGKYILKTVCYNDYIYYRNM